MKDLSLILQIFYIYILIFIYIYIFFFSEISYSRSASISDAVSAIKRNNNVALKGAIQEYDGVESELHGINVSLKNELDLFANLVHIKVRCFKKFLFIFYLFY